jgi:hypothetical protein
MTAGLFALDRLPIPKIILMIGFLTLASISLCWPHTLPLSISHECVPPHDRFDWGLRAGVGLGIGALLGMILVRRRSNNVWTGDAESTIACLAAIGMVGGWQFALGVEFLSFVPRVLVLLLPRGWGWLQHPLSIWLTLAVVIHLLCWRWLLQQIYWPGHAQSSVVLAFAPLLCMGVSYSVDVWEAKSNH